jgi:hypothetical protein
MYVYLVINLFHAYILTKFVSMCGTSTILKSLLYNATALLKQRYWKNVLNEHVLAELGYHLKFKYQVTLNSNHCLERKFLKGTYAYVISFYIILQLRCSLFIILPVL